VETVERALQQFGAPVYVHHEIIHNRHVVDSLRARGARFVEDVSEVPYGAVMIFSAHGVSKAVEAAAAQRSLTVIDATCPLVAKVHRQGQGYAAAGRRVILIGHVGHPEVVGTIGQINGTVDVIKTEADVDRLRIPESAAVAYVTQTTLSVDETRGVIGALKRRFDNLVGPDTDDICYATQNRQAAVRKLARSADVILVVGAPNSSNSNRLREIGEEAGVPSHLLADGSELDPRWIEQAEIVGITAGASAPELMVEDVLDALRRLRPIDVAVMDGIEENIRFRLPVVSGP
jgi:4-hydroxy-3-methylbut-2-enyl diphosphate reductase